MNNIKEKLNKLKEPDLYSLMLFVLYKLHNIPEYSTLSNLSFLLEKDHLLKMCDLFGGTTIYITTITELEEIIYALSLFYQVNVNKKQYNKVIEEMKIDSSRLRKVKTAYLKVCEIMKNYTF